MLLICKEIFLDGHVRTRSSQLPAEPSRAAAHLPPPRQAARTGHRRARSAGLAEARQVSLSREGPAPRATRRTPTEHNPDRTGVFGRSQTVHASFGRRPPGGNFTVSDLQSPEGPGHASERAVPRRAAERRLPGPLPPRTSPALAAGSEPLDSSRSERPSCAPGAGAGGDRSEGCREPGPPRVAAARWARLLRLKAFKRRAGGRSERRRCVGRPASHASRGRPVLTSTLF